MSVHPPSNDPIREALQAESVQSLSNKVKNKEIDSEAVVSFLTHNLSEGSAPLIEKGIVILPAGKKELTTFVTFLKTTKHFNKIDVVQELLINCIRVNNFAMFSTLMEIFEAKISELKISSQYTERFFNYCLKLLHANQCDPSFAMLLISKGAPMEAAVMSLTKSISGKRNIVAADLSGAASLHEAVSAQNIAVITQLLNEGADCDTGDSFGNTPLHIAVSLENEEIVALLIRKGGVNARNHEGLTPLHIAVEKGNEKIVQLLFKGGAQLEKKDGRGKTPLFLALRYLRLNIIGLLLKLGADIEAKNQQGMTPLLYTVSAGNYQLTDFLLQEGASVKATDNLGNMPLIYAATRQDIKLVQLLLDKGASVNEVNQQGLPPLCMLLMLGKHVHSDFVEFMEDKGASLRVAQEIIDRKKLAHIEGLVGFSEIELAKGVTTKFPVGGLTPAISMNMVIQYFRQYINLESTQKRWNKELSKINQILSILEHYVDANELNSQSVQTMVESVDDVVAKIQRGEPVVFLGGTQTHAINIVFINDKLIVCNRGLGAKHSEEGMVKAGVVYSYPHTMVTKELIYRFTEKSDTIGEFQKIFADFKLTPPTVGDLGFELKKQEAEICSWASSKTALFALLLEFFEKEQAKLIYKEITLFARVHGFHDYKIDHEAPDKQKLIDHDLLKRAGLKVAGKIQARIQSPYAALLTPRLVLPLFDPLPEAFQKSMAQLFEKKDVPLSHKGIEIIKKSGVFQKHLHPDVLSKKLFMAIREKEIPMQVALIVLGADLNLRDEQGHRLLNLCVDQGNIDLIEIMLNYGADPNGIDAQGMTPLQRAVSFARLDIAELLVKRGADPELKNRAGISALSLARQFRNEQFIKLFEKKND